MLAYILYKFLMVLFFHFYNIQDSYVIKYFDALNEYLHIGAPVYFVVEGPYDYTSIDGQNKVCVQNFFNKPANVRVNHFLKCQHELDSCCFICIYRFADHQGVIQIHWYNKFISLRNNPTSKLIFKLLLTIKLNNMCYSILI